MNDHTLRAELLESLREDPELLAWIDDHCLDGLWYRDLEQDAGTWYSPRLKTLLGFTADEEPGGDDWFRERIVDGDRAAQDAALAAHLEHDVPYDQVLRVHHRDGSLRWLRSRGRSLRVEGRPRRMLGTITDLTAAIEGAVDDPLVAMSASRGREQLVLALSSAGIGLWDWDVLSDAESLSDTWLHLLGLERNQLTLTSHDWSNRIHPDDLPMVRDALDAHLRDETPRFSVRYRMRHADGGWRWMESDGRLVERDGNGQPRRMVGVFRDVSPQIAVENELRMAVERAEAATRAKSDFLATMSHEIRTPLNGVIGMTEVLLKTPLPAESREYAETIRDSGELLLTVINDVLDFAKAEAGKLLLEEAPFDPRHLCDHVITLFANEARKRQIELAAVVDATVPGSLLGDETRLRQVLNNLVSNAIKFTEEGSVRIRIEPARIEGRSGIEIAVADTGIGMPKEIQQRIFAPFEQGESSTTRRYGGTGLGLTITERLVRLMGGEIAVDSSPGEGTTMRVRVPMSGTAAVPSTRLDSQILDGKHLLHVDDNAVNQRVVAELCASWGIHVDSCSDAIHALRELRRRDQRYDCLMTDLQMPDIDGLMLLNLMMGDPDIRLLPTILLSSDGNVSVQQQARALGFVTVVSKPIRQAKLLEALLAIFKQPQQERSDHRERPLEPGLKLERVLVAEDNTVNQQLLRAQLQTLVEDLRVADDGIQAVEAALDEPFDLILMDVQMPGLDGYAATRAIRADERARNLKRVPIIALTANAMPGDRERCLNAGMDDYLSKPLRSEALHRVLAKWAGRSPRREEPGSSRLSSQTMAAFDLLYRSVGEKGLRELVNVSLRSFARLGATMTTALGAGELETVEREAQAIKGSAAGLGLTRLAASSQRLWQAARDGDLAACREVHREWAGDLTAARELLDHVRTRPEMMSGKSGR